MRLAPTATLATCALVSIAAASYHVDAAGSDSAILTVPVGAAGGRIFPVDHRYADTRADGQTLDGRLIGTGPIPPGSTYRVVLGGREGIPASAESAALNVIAVDPAATGFLVVGGCDQPWGATSNINFGPHHTVAGLVLASMATGSICIESSASTNVVVDVIGTLRSTTGHAVRIIDSRIGLGMDRLRAGQFEQLPSNGTSLPTLANLTGVGADDRGYIQVAPCSRFQIAEQYPDLRSTLWPETSSLNVSPGRTDANAIVYGYDSCISSSTDVDIVLDQVGASSIDWHAYGAVRTFDSRSTATRVDARRPIRLDVWSSGRRSPEAWLANLTSVDPDHDGYLVAYSCGEDMRPPADVSTMQLAAGEVVAHLTVVNRRTDEDICVWSTASTDLIVDVVGSATTDVGFALQYVSQCDLVTLTVDGPGPRNSVNNLGEVSTHQEFSILGEPGDYSVAAVGPPDWDLSLTDHGHGSWSLDWQASADSATGDYPIQVTARSSGGASITAGSTVHHTAPSEIAAGIAFIADC